MRRSSTLVVAAIAALAVLTGCGDDDRPGGTDEGAGPSAPGATVEAGSGSSTTTSTVVDAEAEDAPARSGGEDEGMGDDFVYVADLRGEGAAPAGEPAGRIEIRTSGTGELCIDVEATGTDGAPTDAHVHEAPVGQHPEPVVDLGEPTATDGATATWTDVCAPADDDLLLRLDTDATAFHADVHVGDDGRPALSGQLDYATIFDLQLSEAGTG